MKAGLPGIQTLNCVWKAWIITNTFHMPNSISNSIVPISKAYTFLGILKPHY
jgi:hypothetical protein